MIGLISRKKFVALILCLSALCTVLFCSKKNNPVTPSLQPTIILISPSTGDTVVANEVTTVNITGAFTIDAGLKLATFTVNGTNNATVTASPFTIAATLPAAVSTGDTAKFILVVTDNKKAYATDTVRVIRTAAAKILITLPSAPTGDTTVANGVTSFRVTGSISFAPGLTVTAFSANDVSLLDSLSASNTFGFTVTPSSDTTIKILKLTDSKGNIALDTIRIFRGAIFMEKGKAMLTGTMFRPGTGATAKRLAKAVMASNASGRLGKLATTAIPLTGADILFYNADSISTASAAAVKTDSTGKWTATLNPGNYFIFAVWFDQVNLELLTTAIQNTKAVLGTIDTTEDKVALSDDVAPMVLSFLDAQAADDNNIFLASNLTQGLPIVITFSEPMNRMSVGSDTTGIILGEIDPKDSTVALKKTLAVDKVWSATNKELRLIPKTPLTVGSYYKVILPITAKDLALNKIATTSYGIFKVSARSELPPFTIKGANIQNGDTISASRVIEIGFSRSIDGISLNKNYTLTPAINCFFEVKGNVARLSFPNDSGFAISTAYTLTIKKGLKDLLGDSLPADSTLSFSTKAALDPATGAGVKAKILGFVCNTMEALIAQDIERFALSFHPLLEVTSSHMENGTEVSSKQNLSTFLQDRKSEAALQKSLAIEGIMFPKITTKIVGTDTLKFKKLIGKSTVGTAPVATVGAAGVCIFIEDVGAGGFKSPQILDSLGTEIKLSVPYKGDTLFAYAKADGTPYAFVVNIPENMGFFSTDKDKRDPRYFGKLQNEKTNVEMELVKITSRNSYTIRSTDTTGWTSTPPAATVLFDLVTTEQMSNALKPTTKAQAISMKIVSENSRLLVNSLLAKQLFQGTSDQWVAQKSGVLNDTNFNLNNFKTEATRAITLIAPAQKTAGVTAPIVFKWSKVPVAKSYVLGLSDAISGGSSGLLIFTTDTTITIGANGEVTGGTVLAVDPSKITIPLPRFIKRLGAMDAKAVYVWKVVGLGDSTSSTITAAPKVNADSDFKPGQQPCVFTLAAIMPDLSQMGGAQQPGGNMVNDFADSDKDFWPDWIEKSLGTNPLDAASKPDMLVDSDKDGIADFFETALGTKPDSATSVPVDANKNHIPDSFESKATWDARLAKDSDSDGWADELEMLMQTDPWNATSKPETYAKGAAPTGSYSGIFFVQADNKECKIALTIYTDTATGGAKVVIDSSGLDIIRAGESVDLKFMFGEWAFYYKIIAGANTGKYLKFRCMPSYQTVEGAVDLSDMVGGGGPFIGRFCAKVGGTTSLGGGGPGPMPGTGPTMNIVQAPEAVRDLVKTLPTSGKIINLVLTKDVTGKYSATLIIDTDAPMASMDAMWQPQMFPMYMFKFKSAAGEEIRLEGAVLKDSAGLILNGPLFINFKQTYEIAIKNGVATPDAPAGAWRGYAKPSTTGGMPNPGTTGPLAFIGSKDSVNAALLITQNMAMNIKDSAVSIIRTVWMEGVMKCKDTSGTKQFQVIEKPNSQGQGVIIGKDKTGNPVLLVMPDGNAGPIQQPQTQQILFTGAMADITAALAASGNMVRVMTSSGMILREVSVNAATLKAIPNPQKATETIYEVTEMGMAKALSFLAETAGGKLSVKDNRPLVAEGVTQTQPGTTGPKSFIVYKGSISNIQNALMTSGSLVMVASPDFKTFVGEPVDAASLKTYIDSVKMPGVPLWIVKNRNNSAKTYLFMADSATGMLAQENGVGKPFVTEIAVAQQPPMGVGVLVPFRGSSVDVQNALSVSNWVFVKDTISRSEPVSLASIISVKDPIDSTKSIIIASWMNQATTKFMFLADSATPNKLALDGTRPIVKSFTGQIVQKAVSYIPYTGALPALAGDMVRLIQQGQTMLIDRQVDRNIVKPHSDSTKPGVNMFKVRDKMDTLQYYLFMADSIAGATVLGLDMGKPVVLVLPKLTATPPTAKVYVPYKGPISIIKIVLTGGVQVANPTFTGFAGEQVDTASVIKYVDPAKPNDTLIVVNKLTMATKKFVFMMDTTTKLLALQGGQPMVVELAGSTKPVQIPLGTSIFRGAKDTAFKALTDAESRVWILNTLDTMKAPITIDPVSLMSIPDPGNIGMTFIVGLGSTAPYMGVKFVFLGDRSNQMLLKKDALPNPLLYVVKASTLGVP